MWEEKKQENVDDTELKRKTRGKNRRRKQEKDGRRVWEEKIGENVDNRGKGKQQEEIKGDESMRRNAGE